MRTGRIGDVWVGGSGASYHVAKSADYMLETRSPAPPKHRMILGDALIQKVEFFGEADPQSHWLPCDIKRRTVRAGTRVQ